MDERTRFQTLPFINFTTHTLKKFRACFFTTMYILGSVDKQLRHVHTLTFSEMQLHAMIGYGRHTCVISGSPNKVAIGTVVHDDL
jgi:hypothetical protein